MTYHKIVLRLLAAVQFVSNILFPKHPLTLFPLLSILYYFKHSRHKFFLIKSVPGELINGLLKPDTWEPQLDTDSCIILNSSVLRNICHSSSNSLWLKVGRYKTNSEGARTFVSCVTQVIGVDELHLKNMCMMASETTLFNIKQKLCCKLNNSADNLYVWIDVISAEAVDNCTTANKQFTPIVATKANVALLQSPVDVGQTIIDELLQSYFESCRYHFVGNVICIDIFKYAPFTKYSGYFSSPKIFCKVLEIEGPCYMFLDAECGYLIRKDYTSLFQSSNSHGYLPPVHTSLTLEPSKVTNLKQDYMSLLLHNCPSGLENLYNDLFTSLKPFLTLPSRKMQGLQPVFLVCGPKGAGKKKVITAVIKALGLNEWVVDCLELKGMTPGYTEGKFNFIFKKVMQFLPCIIVMRNIDALCTNSEGHEDMRVIGAFLEQIAHLFHETSASFPVIIIGTCDCNDDYMTSVTPYMARTFLHVMRASNPNEAEREALLSWIIKRNNVTVNNDVSLSKLAARTSGFLFEDLKALVTHAVRSQYIVLQNESEDKNPTVRCINEMHFERALELMHSAYSDAIGAPKIPSVLWSDIGGLASLKEEITRTITMPLQHPTLIASGLRRSGILLYGPPGTGKTLLAKAVATECNLNFLSVKGPELLNMYVGQSEENVRAVFQRARAASPCIIFFDELDSLAPNRGRSGDSGGVMDRVVSQLLAELDGMQKSTHLYVIGATNRPDLIDPALLRPGRFDKLLYVGVCEDDTAQVSVMEALTRKFHLGPNVNMDDVVKLLPQNLTGADLFSVCSNAWRNAAKRIITSWETGDEEKHSLSSPVVVTMEDFRSGASDLTPSVTIGDLQYFSRLHQQLSG